MSFDCSTQGCEGEAKIGGQCVKCACEAAKAKRGGVEPEGKIPLSNPPQSPFRKGGGEEKEEEMGKTGKKPVIPNCQDCHRARKEGERFYKGKCPACRRVGKLPRKPLPAKVEGPLPAETARDVFGPPPAEGIVETLIKEFYESMKKAARIQLALEEIKALTGARFEVPQIRVEVEDSHG